VNTARHAKAITIEAQARVEDALRNAGENAAEAAAEEEGQAKKELEDYEDKKKAVMDKILVAKGEQATAAVEQTQVCVRVCVRECAYTNIHKHNVYT
jgi:sulfur carrier protein ThiS